MLLKGRDGDFAINEYDADFCCREKKLDFVLSVPERTNGIYNYY